MNINERCFNIFKAGSKHVLHLLSFTLAFSISMPGVFAGSDFDSGMQLINEKEFEKALPYFDRSVDAEPTNGDYHFWRAKCLLGLSKEKEACAEYKLAALFTADERIKDDCRSELARFYIELPKGSVNDRIPQEKTATRAKDGSSSEESDSTNNGEKIFKLSSKKLEWNLALDGRFMQQMQESNNKLTAMARGEAWRGPAGRRMQGTQAKVDLKSAIESGPAHFTVALSDAEKNVLAASDVMIILDHSGSMRMMDCPSGRGMPEPRIVWCAEEIEGFADSLITKMPHGFHFITFDSRPDIYDIRSAAQLRQVLQSLTQGGGSNMAGALDEAFRLHSAHPKQPLLIAVVTDAEIDVHSSEQAIVSATMRFPLPNGVFITLLQVGIAAEFETADRLTYLNNLTARGAAYDAFVGVPFSQVRRDGLGRDLLSGLRLNYPTAQPTSTTSPHANPATPDKHLKSTSSPSNSQK